MLLGSCSYWESKEKRTQERIELELQQIDWNTVDAYPLFHGCDENAPKPLQKACFEKQLTLHLHKALSEYEFTVDPGTRPTIMVTFVVNTAGKVIIKDMEWDPALIEKMPELEGIISQSLKNLPEIAPALKRGIPVSTKYRIPILLNTQ
jgi:hypothetical protein